jgi:hypothetical protein
VRQVPPRTSGAQHVQGGVEVFAPSMRWAGPTALAVRGDKDVGDARPGGVRHIGAVPALTSERIWVTRLSMVVRWSDTSVLARAFVGVAWDADR